MTAPTPDWAARMLAFLDDPQFAETEHGWDWHNTAAHLGCSPDEESCRWALRVLALGVES